MPIIGSFGAGSKGGYGRGGKKLTEFHYLVIAGGGGGGGRHSAEAAAGGAGGGYRTSWPAGTAIELEAGTYPVVVGGGGSGGTGPSRTDGTNGVPSSFSGIESAGGGFGGTAPRNTGGPGGSGGGGPLDFSNGGTGNVPPTSPAQGFDGKGPVWVQPPTYPPVGGAAGGAGGAGGAGTNGIPSPGAGGPGASSDITGSSVARAGGASGAPGAGSNDGAGGAGQAGFANTGGGGGNRPTAGGAENGVSGGSGVVYLRVPGSAAPSITVSPGTNTKTPLGPGDFLLTFTVSGDVTIT